MKREVPTRRRGVGPTLRVALVVWTLFGLLCAASVYWGMRTHGHSPLRIAAYEVLVWCGWAAATPAIAWLARRLPIVPFTWRAAAGHVALALACGLLHHMWWTVLLVTLHPFDAMGVQDLGAGLTDDVRDRMFLEVTIYFAVLGVTYAVDSQHRLREREVREAQLEASLAHARLTALELQLQPHFLFNTLHAIGGLVRQARGPEAVEMIAGLSDLLRYSLDHAGKHLVPLEQEVAIARRYLDIQRLRFSDRLAVAIDLPRETHRARVPALVLQPLVENAVRHGIEHTTGPGVIAIRARRDGDQLVLEVANSGPGLGEVGALDEGIGIANTRARLERVFGSRHAFALRGEPDGVVAAVTLPFEEDAP